MTGLKEIMTRLGIEEIPALGQPFDPSLHNAVMHVEDDSLGENTIAEVFQEGYRRREHRRGGLSGRLPAGGKGHPVRYGKGGQLEMPGSPGTGGRRRSS